MIRGWYDIERGIACVSAGALGFSGTHAQFLERCRRVDASFLPFCHLHQQFQPCPICLGQQAGWDANGSPVEAA